MQLHLTLNPENQTMLMPSIDWSSENVQLLWNLPNFDDAHLIPNSISEH